MQDSSIVKYTAKHKFAVISAQKVRPFANLIRGHYADDAMNILKAYPNRGARLVEKVLKSAMANAEDRNEPDPENLVVVEVLIDGGPMFKRFRPKARGMSSVIKKRMSHITVTLG
ncbi:MAG: 50S ribosomal protein L22 [Thermoguttaceae bacterium]|nr:50S ribosomal protein L22 [Thermoguttaceae bacterium]